MALKTIFVIKVLKCSNTCLFNKLQTARWYASFFFLFVDSAQTYIPANLRAQGTLSVTQRYSFISSDRAMRPSRRYIHTCVLHTLTGKHLQNIHQKSRLKYLSR
jgi:hypothetical protein